MGVSKFPSAADAILGLEAEKRDGLLSPCRLATMCCPCRCTGTGCIEWLMKSLVLPLDVINSTNASVSATISKARSSLSSLSLLHTPLMIFLLGHRSTLRTRSVVPIDCHQSRAAATQQSRASHSTHAAFSLGLDERLGVQCLHAAGTARRQSLTPPEQPQ